MDGEQPPVVEVEHHDLEESAGPVRTQIQGPGPALQTNGWAESRTGVRCTRFFADMVSGASRHPVAPSVADPSSGATRLWRAYSRRSGATRARSGSARRSPPPTRVQIGASGSSVCSGSVVTATAVE